MRRILTFLSDFGSSSAYPAAMKAVASRTTEARIIDITHEIPPYDVVEGSFVLWSVVPYFTKGTVHCAVVDPGVGTERLGLILVAGGQYFVGPDNGLLHAAALKLGEVEGYKIKSSFNEGVSSTFHGRDIFAPVAAQLANEVDITQVGEQIREWKSLDLQFDNGEYFDNRSEWVGQIVSIDRFGNMITNINGSLMEGLVDFGQKVEFSSGSIRGVAILGKSYGLVPNNAMALIVNSVGLLELAIPEGRTSDALTLSVGDEIRLCRDE